MASVLFHWPKMSDSSSWEQLDSTVSNLVVGAASVFESVVLLEESIYDQGSLRFRLLPGKEKKTKGTNKRAKHSIKLLKENQLLTKTNSTSDQCTKIALQTLLENACVRLCVLCCGESRRKKDIRK